MKLVRLTADYPLQSFDCGDEDLNEFLLDDAKHFLAKRIANTFILEDEGKIVAYCCLLNDKVTRLEIIGSQWKKIKDTFPDGKKFRSYPSVKIGRFAVAKEYQSQHIGAQLISIIKALLSDDNIYSAFRFITVDAYCCALDFYRHNGFKELTQTDENDSTRLMYFDMLEIGK